MLEINVYVSGSCRGNPGLGGFACIMSAKGKERQILGSCKKATTCDRMVLSGCENVVQWCNKVQKEPCKIIFHVKSSSILHCSKKTVGELIDKNRANHDLWNGIIRKKWAGNHTLVFVKADDEDNLTLKDKATRLAREQAVRASHEVLTR